MTWEPGWALALERAAVARLALVLGDTDSGKTSLVTHLAGALAARGMAVGVIDADLGQSQIGPPTALGLGRVSRPIDTLGNADCLALAWAGSTSPAGVEDALWAGARRLADRAATLGLQPILVDTGGLVRGAIGLRVALGTVERLGPDLVICLQRADECEDILAGCAGDGAPDVVRLPVGRAARRRSTEERRGYRERAIERHLAGAAALEIALGRLDLGGSAGARGPTTVGDVADLDGALVGLVGDDGEMLGVGRIVAVEPARDRVVIETPVRSGAVARVLVGPERYRHAALSR